jgi:hypothetical protein
MALLRRAGLLLPPALQLLLLSPLRARGALATGAARPPALARAFVERARAAPSAEGRPPIGGRGLLSGAAAADGGRGLLSGAAAADGAFYARRLGDLRAAGALLTARGLLWEAALADAGAHGQSGNAYIADVNSAAKAFVESKALVDRADTMFTLGDLMGTSKGQFVMFLGGKDVGKSLMLAKLAESLTSQGRRVVVMDSRSKGSDLVAGLVSAFQSRPGWLERVLASTPEAARAMVPGLFQAAAAFAAPNATMGIGAAAAKGLGEGIGKAVSSLSASRPAPISLPTLETLLLGFIAASKEEGLFPVLLIDEANDALPSEPAEARARTREALRLLTLLTKQTQQLNVVLAASENAEPFRLAQLGFKTEHMTKTVIACEVPPAEMLAMLRREWGCGPELAAGLAAVYGGNVWRTSLALGDLSREKAGFRALSAFAPGAIDGVAECVLAARGGMEGLEDMLRSIADRGYVSIPQRLDPRAELVSKHNVGGVVSASASAPGIPPEAWDGGADALLVSSSQSMRLLLAKALEGALPAAQLP